jgi:hypothetical protein
MPTADRYSRYREDQTTVWISKAAVALLARERQSPGEGIASVLDRVLNEFRKLRRAAGVAAPSGGGGATKGPGRPAGTGSAAKGGAARSAAKGAAKGATKRAAAGTTRPARAAGKTAGKTAGRAAGTRKRAGA